MKKIIVITVAFILLASVAHAGMGDLERAGTNAKAWNDIARFINHTHNVPCAKYRAFRDSLGKDIADATNSELAEAFGIVNGVSIDTTTAKEIKAVAFGVETICKTAAAVVSTLPANSK